MKVFRKTGLVLLLTLFLVSGVSSFAGGSGTSSDPYEISTCQQLQDMNTDLDAHYELVSDVDCSGTSSWNSGKGFNPVGDSSSPFTGSFDGNFHAVDQLYIDRSSESHVGLFGKLGDGGFNDAIASNVSLKSADFLGDYYVGGIVGRLQGGTISQVFVSGYIESEQGESGGLVGYEGQYSLIEDSYSNATVTASSGNIGGAVGNIYNAEINGVYSTGVVGDNSGSGGLVGNSQLVDEDTSNNYWNKETSNQSTSAVGTGLNTSEMTYPDAQSNMYLDFGGVWSRDINDVNNGYPVLTYFRFSGGSGTSSDPYEISTCQQLQNMNMDLDAHFELVSDVDCSGTSSWNGGSGFDPVGTESNRFFGSFDGNGYTVDQLLVDRPNTDHVGLFGYTGDQSLVSDVGLTNVDMTANFYAGGVVGRSAGSIKRVYSTGGVEANAIAGGIVGYLNQYNTVSNSYSKADVTADEYVGGAIGWGGASSDVTQTYSTGSVSGGSPKGGLVGSTYSGAEIVDSFWDVDTSGISTSAGGTGLTTSEMTYPNAESNIGFLSTVKWLRDSDGDNDGYPELCWQDNESCNSPPIFSNTGITPSTPYIGDSLDYSASADDPDGTISELGLTVFNDGSQVFQDIHSFTNNNPSQSYNWDGFYTAQEGKISARFVATDDKGKSTTTWINRTLSESTPVAPTFNKPSSSSYLEETIQFDVSTSSDGDDKIDESLTCTVFDNGNQVDQYTVTEGSSFTGEYTLDTKGSHTFESECVESDGESSTQTTTFDLQNFAPDLTTAEFVDNRQSSVTKLLFGLDDRGESDIDSFSGTGTLNSLTNSLLDVGVSLPVSSSYSVSDTDGVSSNSKTVDVSESDSGVREDDYGHTLDAQRINRTVTISNDAGSPVNYSLTTALPGSTVVQGQSFEGTISASGSVTHTSITQDDWVTGETESPYSKYSDGDYNHTENSQRIHNRTQLVVDNSRSFAFNDVDISSTCSRTTTASVSSGNDVLVTDDCSRPTFTVDLIDTSTTVEAQDDSKNQTVDVQYLTRSKTVTEVGGYSWSNVDIFSPGINGSCSDCGTRTINLAADESVTETYHSSSDWINDSVSQESDDSSYDHDLSSQGTYIAKELNESGGYNWSNVSVPPPEINGSCENCGLRNLDFSPGESKTEYYNASSDWVVNESESVVEIAQNTSAAAGVDQQTLYNQTRLRVDNTRNFSFSSVDISSQCSLQTEVNISSGESVVTQECSNTSFSGDWIRNEENQSTQYDSGEVILGKGLSESFTATQDVEGTNVRTGTDLRVDVDPLVSDIPGCSVVNSTQREFPADSVTGFTFHKSCSPGGHLNRTPVTKTETESFYKYHIKFGFQVNSNLTEEQPVEYAVKTDWADNWNSRDPTETEAVVDSSGKDIQLEERIIDGTEYIVFQIGENRTNSSIHTGTHSASLTYYETKSPGSTSGGSSSGGGGSSSGGGLLTGSTSETQVDEVTSSKFNWTVSAITSEDAQSFQVSGYPGASFEKYIVVRNTGDSNVTLDIDCVSVRDMCSWVNLSVDRVVLNRNSFSEKQIKVSGTVPPGFDGEDAPAQFGIRVSDPEFNGSQSGPHVSYVDFTVTNSPVLGRLLDGALKALEFRSFESPVSWGHSVAYPFILIPLFWSLVVNGLWSLGEWLLTLSKRNRWWSTNLKWIATVLVFLFTYILVP